MKNQMKPSTNTNGPAGGNRIRLLLVDDEKGFLDVLSKRIRRRKFDVTVAGGGAEALRVLRKQDFDAAVLDLKMEDMDGIEVLKIFKKMVPHLPVIMLTGHGSEQSAAEGFACGACEYLMKPCELEELIETIHRAIGRK